MRRFYEVLQPLEMPWYQPGVPRGYSKFYTTNVGDRLDIWLVTDPYLNALERAYHQGQFDAGIDNVEDTSSVVFDFLAANGVTTTDQAYALGRSQTNPDPGGSIDPNYISGTANTPGIYPATPAPAVIPTASGMGLAQPQISDAIGTVTTSVVSREGYQGPPDIRYSGPPGGAVPGTWAGGNQGIASQPTTTGSFPAFGSQSSSILAAFANPYMIAAVVGLYFLLKKK